MMMLVAVCCLALWLVGFVPRVIFLLPSRECMRENNYFWSPSQSMTLCSISSDFLFEIAFSQLYNYHNDRLYTVKYDTMKYDAI